MSLSMGELELVVRDSGADALLKRLGLIDATAAKLGAKAVTLAVSSPNAAPLTRTLAGLGTIGEQSGAKIAKGMQTANLATDRLSKSLDQVQRGWEAEARKAASFRSGPMLGPALPGMTTGVAAQASAAAGAQAAQASAQAEKLNATITRVITNIVTMGREVDVASAKAVAGFKGAADATTAYAVKLGATEAQLNRIGAAIANVDRRQAVAAQTNTRTATSATSAAGGIVLFGRSVTEVSGRLSAFSMRGLGAMNAVAFGVSQLATTGTTSFRSLASAAAGFLSFFGPGGAIASIGINAGLAITDFFSRTRKEIAETSKKALEEAAKLDQALESGRRARDPAGAIQQLADATTELREKSIEQAAIEHRTEAARTAVEKERLIVLKARIAELQQEVKLQDQIARNPRAAVGTGMLPERTIEVKSAVKAEKDRQEALSKNVEALSKLASVHALTISDFATLRTTQRLLTEELKRQNLTLERQAEIREQLRRLDILGAPPSGVSRTLLTPAMPAPRIDPDRMNKKFAEMARLPQGLSDLDKERLNFEDAIANSIADSVVGGITRGFAEGLARDGLKEGFKALASDVLSGLGSVFMQVGQRALLASAFIQKIAAGIAALNPWIAIPSAIALMALGSSMRGGARGGGGGGGTSSFSAPSSRETVTHIWLDPDRNMMSPRPGDVAPVPRGSTSSSVTPERAQTIVNNFTVIGPNDPRAQEQIVRLVNNGVRAGYRIDT